MRNHVNVKTQFLGILILFICLGGCNPSGQNTVDITLLADQDQVTTVDLPLSPIGFTVSYIETGQKNEVRQPLILKVSSENQNVVADSGIQVTGDGAQRSLIVNPVPGASGSSWITISAYAGEYSDTEGFMVWVTPPDSPFSFDEIPDQTLTIGKPADPIHFSIDYFGEEAPEILAHSDTQEVIGDSEIILSGSGAKRSLAINPQSGMPGVAHITLTATKGKQRCSETFLVTLAEPLISVSEIPDQITTVNKPVPPIPIKIDTTQLGGTLTVSVQSDNQNVVPNTGLIAGGTGEDRVISITPAVDATGTANIKVEVSNGNSKFVVHRTFKVTVEWEPPLVAIISPQTGEEVIQAKATPFVGSAIDVTGRPIDENFMIWSVDGADVGEGPSLNYKKLTIGPHIITLTATDPQGFSETSTVHVTVKAYPNRPMNSSIWLETSPIGFSKGNQTDNTVFFTTPDKIYRIHSLTDTASILFEQPKGNLSMLSASNEAGFIEVFDNETWRLLRVNRYTGEIETSLDVGRNDLAFMPYMLKTSADTTTTWIYSRQKTVALNWTPTGGIPETENNSSSEKNDDEQPPLNTDTDDDQTPPNSRVFDPTSVCSYPTNLVITNDEKKAYIVCRNQDEGNEHSIYAVNLTEDQATPTPINFNGYFPGRPHSIALTPDDRFAYVTNSASETVLVLDTTRDAVIEGIFIGHPSAGLAVAPDGKTVYIANQTGDSLTILK